MLSYNFTIKFDNYGLYYFPRAMSRQRKWLNNEEISVLLDELPSDYDNQTDEEDESDE